MAESGGKVHEEVLVDRIDKAIQGIFLSRDGMGFTYRMSDGLTREITDLLLAYRSAILSAYE